jgi:hypothetical protein
MRLAGLAMVSAESLSSSAVAKSSLFKTEYKINKKQNYNWFKTELTMPLTTIFNSITTPI